MTERKPSLWKRIGVAVVKAVAQIVFRNIGGAR